MNSWAKYTGLAFQMGIVIFIGTWGGQQLDQKFQTEKPILSLICIFFSIISAIYIAIKDFISKKN